jgi:hypothetical protein
MKIKKKFLQLTSKTFPHGTENELKNQLPTGYKEDGLGNFYIEIGKNSTTMFTCHLDTADRSQTKVKHILEGNIIKTDGTSILGADDKAGMTVLLYMIEKKIPGLYYFFIGEERGCVGSGRLSRVWKDKHFSNYVTKCVSFDRRGTDSVITEQFYGVCCSNEFAKELSKRLNVVETTFNYKPDPTGIYTDSAQFTNLIPECTNISVGYYSEHTTAERQDIKHLEKLCEAVCKIDWETLPIVKEPGVHYDEYDEDDEWEYDEDQKFQSHNFAWVSYDGKTTKMMISDDYIEVEKETILSWMNSSGLSSGYVDFTWDGQSLHGASYSGEYQFIATRSELVDFVEDLKQIPADQLKSFN